MSIRARRVRSPGNTVVIAGALALIACAGAPTLSGPTSSPAAATRWVDSVLATLSPRDRAAQLVWPQVLADFTPDGSPGWERVAQLVGTHHVGGFVLSVGSPTETGAKVNALQRLSPVPLLFGADYEAGAG